MEYVMKLAEIQEALRDAELDGWLFFDHHQRDPLAYRVLRFKPRQMPTRRWYYFVPTSGEPTKVVHRIESKMLDALPGRTRLYAGWTEQQATLCEALGTAKRVAMQYSPNCAIPYVSMIDAGTAELVRGMGMEITSSADLIQLFEATWTAEQFVMHIEAGKRVDAVRRAAFEQIQQSLSNGRRVDEFGIQQFIRTSFDREELVTDHGPIVAVNEHASDPHYEPSADSSRTISPSDVVLIDLWAKLNKPESVYYDITWAGYCRSAVPSEIANVFGIVAGARDAAIDRIQQACGSGQTLRGCDVDDVARSYITERGFGEFFFHRTGHSIGEDVHGTGANMDNLETHDDRRLQPHTCFSIEPGVYLPKFGIRSEVNVYVEERGARVTGEIQRELLLLG
jgi:Xaa-Pro dipeptidase